MLKPASDYYRMPACIAVSKDDVTYRYSSFTALSFLASISVSAGQSGVSWHAWNTLRTRGSLQKHDYNAFVVWNVLRNI